MNNFFYNKNAKMQIKPFGKIHQLHILIQGESGNYLYKGELKNKKANGPGRDFII